MQEESHREYHVQIGKYIHEAWELFLKAPEIFVTIALAFIAFHLFFGWIPFAGNLASLMMFSLWLPSIFLFADQLSREGRTSLTILKNLLDPIPTLVLTSLLTNIFTSIGFLFFLLPGIYLMVAYLLTSAIVLFEKKSFWESMEMSRLWANKNWFGLFGFLIVTVLIVFAGLLFVGVGLLVTFPLGSLMIYAAFRDIQKQLLISK